MSAVPDLARTDTLSSVSRFEREVLRIMLPYPHRGQRTVMRQARRINVLSAGRRWRKTTMGLSATAPIVLAGGTVVWGAPTYDQVYTAWEELAKAAGNVAKFREGRMTASFPGGGRYMFRSLADPDNARSKTADAVVVDEAADVVPEAYHEVLRPMLMDTNGVAWLMGTPKGRNWFWKLWANVEDQWVRYRAGTAPEPHAMAFQIPTLGCRITQTGLVREPHPMENPDIKFEEILDLYQNHSELVFRQEILAEFIEDAGGVFRGVLDCARGAIERPHDGYFVLGVDWGKLRDFTVLTMYDPARHAVVDFDRFNQIDWAVQFDRLKAMHQKWTKAGATVQIVAESNSMGDMAVEQLRRSGLPINGFLTTSSSKQAIIENLQGLIERREITYPDIPALVNELQAFEAVRSSSGNMRFSAPEGLHDDTVMSLAIAVWSAREETRPVRSLEELGGTDGATFDVDDYVYGEVS